MRLYVDPQSPYAYLADLRLGEAAELQPIALGAIMVKRGWGSWAATETRAENIAEVERRGAELGLPPFTWPKDWPAQTLAPARATAWAHQRGEARAFLREYWRLVFHEGQAAGSDETLGRAAGAEVVVDQALKDALRSWTDAAWELGVRGVPTLETNGDLVFGDDAISEQQH